MTERIAEIKHAQFDHFDWSRNPVAKRFKNDKFNGVYTGPDEYIPEANTPRETVNNQTGENTEVSASETNETDEVINNPEATDTTDMNPEKDYGFPSDIALLI